MRTPKLVVSAFTGASSFWLYMNNQLILKDSGEVIVDLESGTDYLMFWYVEGQPASAYSITISSPREAEYQLTKALRASGKDHGSLYFSVPGVPIVEEPTSIAI